MHAFLTTLLLLLFWQLFVAIANVPDYILPPPLDVLKAMSEDVDVISSGLSYTIIEWLIGLAASIVFATVSALICFRYDRLMKILTPVLTMTQSIPTLVLAPLLLIWFGLGMAPKIILVVVSCFFPILLALLSGLHSAKKEYGMLAEIFYLTRIQALRHIFFPRALRELFIGLKVSASYAFVSAVMVELIGSEKGLGIYLIRAQASYRTDAVLGVVFIMIAFSLLSTKLLSALQSRLVFWEK